MAAATCRCLWEGYRRTTVPETTAPDRLQTVVEKPPTRVTTGVSAGYRKPRTTAVDVNKAITVVVVEGQKFVVHNGINRSKEWVLKQRNTYYGRQRDYRIRNVDTTVVNANIKLFTRYINEIEKAT